MLKKISLFLLVLIMAVGMFFNCQAVNDSGSSSGAAGGTTGGTAGVISATKIWTFESDAIYGTTSPVPAGAYDDLTFVDGTTVRDLSARTADVDGVTYNFTNRLRLQKTGSTTAKAIKISVSGPCTIFIAVNSGSSTLGITRDLTVSNGTTTIKTFTLNDASNDPLVAVTPITVDSYDYTGGATDLYFYTAQTSGAVSLYLLEVKFGGSSASSTSAVSSSSSSEAASSSSSEAASSSSSEAASSSSTTSNISFTVSGTVIDNGSTTGTSTDITVTPSYTGDITSGLNVVSAGKIVSSDAGTGDSLYFIGNSLTGDFTLSALVTVTTTQGSSTRNGLMIRNTLDPQSQYAMIDVRGATASLGVRTESRGLVSGAVGTSSATTTAPYYLKLVKVGQVITTSFSTDGATWTVHKTYDFSSGATYTPFDSTFYLGFCAESGSLTKLGATTFTNITITQ